MNATGAVDFSALSTVPPVWEVLPRARFRPVARDGMLPWSTMLHSGSERNVDALTLSDAPQPL